MTVKELQRVLDKFHPEDEVILSRDAEGNSFSPLEEISHGEYIPYNSWSGELRHRRDEDDDEIHNEKAIFLWPVN